MSLPLTNSNENAMQASSPLKNNYSLMKTKYTRYQDYVISDGKLIGEFEDMYRDFEDPWEQSVKERNATEKGIAVLHIEKLLESKKKLRIIEYGCGFGDFAQRIKDTFGHNVEVAGVDVSQTAIQKAKEKHPNLQFFCADILSEEVWNEFRPDVIIFAEITWYVLEKLRPFLLLAKQSNPDLIFIHLLTTYNGDAQKYGKEYFTDLSGILKFFDLDYMESGEILNHIVDQNCKRTYFIGTFKNSYGNAVR